ncbi:MAG: hypothetical protein MHPSP_002406, partial [Paramarteilia canceri]
MKVQSVMALILDIKNINLSIRCLTSSGTISSLEDKIIVYSWQRLFYLRKLAKKGSEEYKNITEVIERCRPYKIREENQGYE